MKKLDNVHIGSALVLVALIAGSLVAAQLDQKEIALALLTMAGGLILPQPVRGGQ